MSFDGVLPRLIQAFHASPKRARLIAILVLLLVGGSVLFYTLRSKEPVYGRKKLSVWLEYLDDGSSVWRQRSSDEQRAAAIRALRAMGTNALPTLKAMLLEKPSLGERVLEWTYNQPFDLTKYNFSVTTANDLHVRALNAYRILGPLAVPDLIAALRNPDEGVRGSAAQCLGEMRERAQVAVPALIATLSQRNSYVEGVEALGKIGPPAKQAIPALMKALNDTDAYRRWCVAKALVNIDPSTTNTVPGLTIALKEGAKTFSKPAIK
jgi:HEAT repeat protein